MRPDGDASGKHEMVGREAQGPDRADENVESKPQCEIEELIVSYAENDR